MRLRERYLDLLMKSVLEELHIENEARLLYLRACLGGSERFDQGRFLQPDASELSRLAQEGRLIDDNLSNLGFPHTMIGRRRLENVRQCLEAVVGERVPGDLIECGVWRGGAAIFMRGFLAAYGIDDRTVWAADSFEGPPPPSLPQDCGEDLSAAAWPALAVPLETVKGNFERYGLLDAQVRFLPGWFKDTLPRAPIDRLALLRIDGDLYESTRDALENLYGKLSPGGFAIVDDYGAIPACRQAVDEFRAARGVTEALVQIDWTGVYWRRNQPPTASRVFSIPGVWPGR